MTDVSPRKLAIGLIAGGLMLMQGALIASLTAGSAAATPPGNNGTVKIENVDVDSVDDPNGANHPHVTSPFAIRWYGFDEGTRTVTVSFAGQPPSGTSDVAVLEGRSSFTFTSAGGGGVLNHTEIYRLDTTGLDEQANQGFHIKVTVTTDGSQGNDTKSKVFWMKPGAVPSESPSPSPSPSPSESPSPSPSPSPSVSPSVLPTELVSPSISPSVLGVKIVKTLPKTGGRYVGATAALGAALVLMGAVLLTAGRRGAHQL